MYKPPHRRCHPLLSFRPREEFGGGEPEIPSLPLAAAALLLPPTTSPPLLLPYTAADTLDSGVTATLGRGAHFHSSSAITERATWIPANTSLKCG